MHQRTTVPFGLRHRKSGVEDAGPSVPRNKEKASVKRFWIVVPIVVTFGFTVLGWVGRRFYQEMLPVPEPMVTSDR